VLPEPFNAPCRFPAGGRRQPTIIDSPTVKPNVLLFDIDGTLVTMAGVGRRAFDRAFERLHGRSDACSLLRFDGATDRAMTRLALQGIGVAATESAIDELLAAYLPELESELSRPGQPFRVYPGVLEVLQAARASGAAVGLGTGNIKSGARLKLEHFDLYRHFDFGGFGDDHELRPELIRRGAERGAALLGVELDACRVVVIGDTPKDVDAALAIGAEALGIGTAAYTAEQLLAHGATATFPDLTAPGFLPALLGA
jgi:phosphoglycolate phosphatase-like HAD superfamily hydrolase